MKPVAVPSDQRVVFYQKGVGPVRSVAARAIAPDGTLVFLRGKIRDMLRSSLGRARSFCCCKGMVGKGGVGCSGEVVEEIKGRGKETVVP